LTFVCSNEHWNRPSECPAGLLPVALSAGYKLLLDLLEAHCVVLIQKIKWLSEDAMGKQRPASDDFDVSQIYLFQLVFLDE